MLVLFVEGDTEKVFYERVIQYLSNQNQITLSYKIRNIKGIYKFQRKIPPTFHYEFMNKYKDRHFYVICAYDTDRFKFDRKPPVDWSQIKKDLINVGAEYVRLIGARNMIEDWFLTDIEGICSFLNISVPNKVQGTHAAEKMDFLFKRANKRYVKGTKSNEFVTYLDIGKIVEQKNGPLKPLIHLFTASNKQ